MQFVYFILAGALGGVLAGMGMGGGTLTLPILVVVMGVGQLTAQFANLVAFVPSGTLALCLHMKNNLVVKDNVARLLIPALCACIATSFAVGKTDGELLKRLFGGFLVAVSLLSYAVKIAKR